MPCRPLIYQSRGNVHKKFALALSSPIKSDLSLGALWRPSALDSPKVRDDDVFVVCRGGVRQVHARTRRSSMMRLPDELASAWNGSLLDAAFAVPVVRHRALL